MKAGPRQPGPRALEREARRLLPRLARGAAFLAPLPDGDFGLFTAPDASARPVDRTTRNVVEALAARQLLTVEDGRHRMSELGEAWLKRMAGGADGFQAQHQSRVERLAEAPGGGRRPVVVNDSESPLAWLRGRKGRGGEPLVTEAQFRAGERLRADFWRARLTPRVTADWSSAAPARRSRRAPSGAAATMSDEIVTARQSVTAALHAVGPELAGLLIDVCGHLTGLEQSEQARGWPRRSAKVVLRIALERLASHYGIGRPNADAEPRRPGLRHWGTDDFRPTLEEWC